MTHGNALIIIAKDPRNGNVKTRLRGHLTDEKILQLYEYLLRSTLTKFSALSWVDTFIAYAPEDAEQYFLQFNLPLIPLSTPDLGMNMYHAFKKVFEKGYGNAALIGADIPGLTESVLTKAFELLDKNDLVSGPAQDGGYYLVGMRKLIKEVFENVPWSSEHTLKESCRQAGKFGYTVGFTEMLSDIDTIDDIHRSGLDVG